MTHIFEGRVFADKKLEALEKKVAKLRNKGVTPKLVSIVVGDEEGAIFYQNLKKKVAEKIGCELLVVSCGLEISVVEIIKKIKKLNKDPKVHGIMLQLPLPKNFSTEDRDEIISAIASEKDIDGMRVDSKFGAPVVVAVIEILGESLKIVRRPLRNDPLEVVMFGAKGFVGSKIVHELKKQKGLRIEGVDVHDSKTINRKSDVVISATGVSELITPEMVKDGAILIDVGAPVGDVAKDAYEKAAFVSPVPGGVGPVTIACLMENLVESANK